MLDLMALPVPDLGLKCPHCEAALAGLNEHRCAACGESFNLLTLLAQHRPIPDLGLACPTCGYSLTGLEGSRCPECGEQFSLLDILEELREIEPPPTAVLAGAEAPDHTVARRKPRFTGRERPLPDFGVACHACGEMLAGAVGDICPCCGTPYDLSGLQTGGKWIDISSAVPKELVLTALALLGEDLVPYFTHTLRNVYTGGLGGTRLLVPREFVFDALHVLAEGRAAAAETTDESEWICPSCNETVPGNFEECWHCQTARDVGNTK